MMNGLVLQGGGTRGAYHIGVWRALRELGIEIHAVTGTSIGAVNGVMIALDKYDEAYDLWYNIKVSNLFDIDSELYKRMMEFEFNTDSISAYFKYMSKTIKERGIDVTPLKELIEKFVDEEAVRNSIIDFGLVTVDLTNFKPIELFIKDIPKGKLNEYLLGSAHFPIFKMDKVDGKLLIDGMFYDNQPVNLMMKKPGIDTIIIIDNRGIGIKHKVDLNGYNVMTIKANKNLGRTFDLSLERARNNLNMGYYDTLRAYNGYLGLKYYIMDFDEKEILSYIYQLENNKINRIAEILDLGEIKYKKQIFEEIIPKIYKILKIPNDIDYKEFFVTIIEEIAEYFSIECYEIYNFYDLLEIIKEILTRDEMKAI